MLPLESVMAFVLTISAMPTILQQLNTVKKLSLITWSVLNESYRTRTIMPILNQINFKNLINSGITYVWIVSLGIPDFDRTKNPSKEKVMTKFLLYYNHVLLSKKIVMWSTELFDQIAFNFRDYRDHDLKNEETSRKSIYYDKN